MRRAGRHVRPVDHDRPASFEEAFEDLYTRAYGVAYQLLGRRSEAEDVAQETLARAFVRWRQDPCLRRGVGRAGRRQPGDRRLAAPPPGRHRCRHRASRCDRTRPRRATHRPPPGARHPVAPPARGHRPALPRRPPRGRRGEGAGLLGGLGEAARQPRTRHPQDDDGRRRRRATPRSTDAEPHRFRPPRPVAPGSGRRPSAPPSPPGPTSWGAGAG